MKNVNKSKMFTIVGVFLAMVLIVCAVMIWVTPQAYTVTTYSMGSYVQQNVYGKNREGSAKKAANEIAELENKISWRIAGSETERLNLNAGTDFIEIDEYVYNLLFLSREVAEKSDGAFDITIAPLSRLWDFDSETKFIPNESIINQVKNDVNYRNILMQDNSKVALKNEQTAIDLGAVGKGAACDVAAEVYKEQGVSNAVISVGGSVGVYGKKAFGQPWIIGVRDPNGDGVMGEISIKEGFISTSGSYEKSFTEYGVLYHHLLDPKTGYPAESGLLSVTVVAESGALSDMLSTACFVLGYEEGLALLDEFDAEGIFITTDKKVYLSEGLEGKFKIKNENYKYGK